MRFLIVPKDLAPFYVAEYRNNVNFTDGETIVFDILRGMHTVDGKTWESTNVED